MFFFFSVWKQLRQIVGRTSVSLVILTYGSWREGHHDLYFTVQWFCLISWRLFYIWTPYFRIMSQYDMTFDLKINVGHCDLYFMVQWFCLISWWLFAAGTSYIWYMNTILWDYGSQYDSWSSDFTLYLENYSVAEHYTLELWVSMTRCLTSKYL